jgi:hypothetical protein
MEGHLQMLPLQLSYEIVIDSGICQQGDYMVTDNFKTPKGDLVQSSHCDFWSYLEDFDEHPFENLDLFY